jgi:histidinol-phosphate/aromatic aminotransferase/cobyric acid decarboxylase-like protein/adenosyl cobinamide kinase/adenosyl cobinamide phosphate guanylyltransferase
VSLTLVVGGTRSGKSRRAESLASATGRAVRYVATADPADPSMSRRIARHAARRPASWSTRTAGDALADALADVRDGCVLIDGLGVWIGGVLHRAGAFAAKDAKHALDEARRVVEREVGRVVAASAEAALIVVAEDAGHGLVPTDRGSRAWLDLLGEATQRLAGDAAHVELVVAGRPLAVTRGDAVGLVRHHGDRDLRAGDADHAVTVVSGGTPEWLSDLLSSALANGAGRYPDERDAERRLAALHGRRPDEVVTTNGATEALWLLPAALRPALVACVHPAFTEGEAAMRAHGIPVARVLRDPDQGFRLDPRAVPAEADVVIVGNPASPSGTLDPAPTLLALRRPGRVIVIDEAFIDLVPGEPGSLAGEGLEDIIVLRSATKSLSIPGLRAGYALAAPALAERLRAVRPPWSANCLALAALAAIAERPATLAAAAERAQAERADLETRLAALDGIRIWPASANFVLARVADGPRVVAGLREHRIAVRPAASFPGLGPDYIRITARDPERNTRLVRALADLVGVRERAVVA